MIQKKDNYSAELIEGGISSRFWKEYLVLELNEDIEDSKRRLASCSMDEVRPLQERIRHCQEWLRKPMADLKKAKGGHNEW